jgi:outer membrane immunogenic protein
MRHLVTTLVSAAMLGLGLTVAASAADMAVKAPVYKAPPAPIGYSWSGFYIGGNVGGAWSQDWNSSATSSGPNVPGGIASQLFQQNASSAVAGGQIGYNWQVSPNWVLGVETDLQWTHLNGTSTGTFAGLAGVTACMCRDVDWFGTARGRVGYTWDRWMAYATGGLAYGHVAYTANINAPAGAAGAPFAVSFPVSFSNTKTGWTAGAGLEWAFGGNWSAKAEYLYVSLGSADASSTGVPSVAPNIVNYHWNDTNFHVARFGLNYRFGGP